VALLNVNIPGFLKEFDRDARAYATLGMAPESPGSDRVWAVVYVQEG
jgi:hypothetical protein